MISTTKKDYTVHIGSAIEILQELPVDSFHCCVTSPPYYDLRDYEIEGQIGHEETPQEYINSLVKVFKEVQRVLRPDGTFWLNVGDTYTTGSGGSGTDSAKQKSNRGTDIAPRKRQRNTKPKNLNGIPWKLAFALQDDGWYVRSDIIWDKPNAMCESVNDRPIKSYEHIFLLSKSPSYYYDKKAIAEKVENSKYEETRNVRDVWRFPVIQPVKGKSGWSDEGDHFAVFPPELPLRCILAGSSEWGCCSTCGKAWNDEESTCKHKGTAVPCRILDPFSGSGTTGIVAISHNRAYTGIELNPLYARLWEEKFDKYSATAMKSRARLPF